MDKNELRAELASLQSRLDSTVADPGILAAVLQALIGLLLAEITD